MEDVIAKKFLEDRIALAQKRVKEYSTMIRNGFTENITKLEKSFFVCLEQVTGEYGLLEAAGETGRLSYIYISFLRTSVLTEVPHYRIDLYDERDRISLTECAIGWDFEYVFQYFHLIKEELEHEFVGQTRVKGYELDRILYEAAEEFHQLAFALMEEMLRQRFLQHQSMEPLDEGVSIYMGDFLDKAVLLLAGCGRRTAVTGEAGDDGEEAEDDWEE